MLDLILGNIEWLIGAIGVLLAVVFARNSGKTKERLKQKEADLERAKAIRDRVDRDFDSVRDNYTDRGYRD